MRRIGSIANELLACALSVACSACTAIELGECDPDAARSPIYYDGDGFPAYPGQALVEASCSGRSYCHTSDIAAGDRRGAPVGIELDVGVAFEDGDLSRLAHAHEVVRSMSPRIYEQVVAGTMPPPPPEGLLDSTPSYRALRGTPDEHALPSIDTDGGRSILRNWLACGAPVVEGVEGQPTGIGDIVARTNVCPSGQAFCDGACIDVSVDPANCGGCGVACGPEQRCMGARCECIVALDACGASCVELASDAAHCGRCDTTCDALCAMGACVTACPAGTTDCGGSCADLSSSVAHCGRCDMRCMAGETCSAGACSCAEGYLRCGDSCVDPRSDPAHCGACDSPCSAGSLCTDGACACPAGTTGCGGECVSTDDDERHCGTCGHACAPGESCAGGSCASCGTPVRFAADVQPIFTMHCATSRCHTGARPQASLSLEEGRAWSELVGVPSSSACAAPPLVTPGNEDASYLMNKLLDVDICSGTQMPKQGEPLSAAEIAVIRSWICSGAAND